MEFTVLITVYRSDKPKLFKKALQSIYDNSLLPLVVLLVVDGPVPDELNNIIELYERDNGLLVKRLDENVGLAMALNFGLSFVETEWVVRADSDDVNHFNRFDVLSKYMNDDYDLVGSAVREVDEDSKVLSIRKPPEKSEDIIRFCETRNPFNHMSVCFRKALVRKVGGYPNIYLREDYALWALLISNNSRVYNIQDVLVDATAGLGMYRRRGGFRYALGEIYLQKHLVKCGVKGLFQACYQGLFRAIIFLIPTSFRACIYQSFLRS
jgi:glycosyltransferase involved in cell wall biosynthesis